jgi:23S rRNA maturation mini-RNase III
MNIVLPTELKFDGFDLEPYPGVRDAYIDPAKWDQMIREAKIKKRKSKIEKIKNEIGRK